MNTGKASERFRKKSQSKTRVDCGPKYSKVSESLRYATSGSVQCSMFCGGRQCKYEGPEKWTDSEMAVKGLYSSWVTDNILAMARPTTRNITKFNIIQQFQRWGITAVINLQHPGEHANCGHGLENGGFSYNPQDFMDNGIFFYNFIWKDYGVRSLESVLDMVKVMDFALQEGKISVHCHAGLGRTGVLIASYLIYSLRMAPEQAIHTVRKKRPKSVQTRDQISCVQDFSKFLKPLWIVFPICYAFGVKRFTLEKYLVHQRRMLHGYEARELKYVPKVILNSCKRILDICNLDSTKLKITDSRVTGKQDETVEKQGNCCDINNALNIEGQPVSHISASLEDLKGECDDMPEMDDVGTDFHCLSNSALSHSQPSGLQLFETDKLHMIPKTHTKSDSALLETHRKDGKELDLEQNATENNRNNVEAFETARLQQMKSTSTSHSVHKPLTHRNSSAEMSSELAATSFALEKEQDDEIIFKVQTLQRVLNESNEGWDVLDNESNIRVLTALILSWVTTLTQPVLCASDIRNLVYSGEEPSKTLLQLNRAQRGICECLFVTVFKLDGLPHELRDKALLNIVTALSHCINTTRKPATDQSCAHTASNGDQDHLTDEVSPNLISDCLKYLASLYDCFIKDTK